MRIDHINIKAPADLLHKVRDFYCQVLNLEEGFRPHFSKPGFWLYSNDRPLVHLSEDERSHSGTGSGYLDHIAFQAEELSVVLARLDSHHISYRKSFIPELNMNQLFFKDPAGTGLEVNFPNAGAGHARD